MSSNEVVSLILTQSDEVVWKPNLYRATKLLILTQSVKDLILNFQLSFYCKNTPVVVQLSLTRLEQLSFYCKNTSPIFQLSVTRFEQLSFYCKETSAIKKSPRQRLQNMMRSMTSYEVVYIRQRGLVSSLKCATRFYLSRVRS